MQLSRRLRALVELLPDDVTITLSARTLLDWLSDEGSEGRSMRSAVEADLTLAEVSSLTHRSESTVRGWLSSGHLPGAYKLRGRAWRVPRASLEALRATPSASETNRRAGRRESRLAWRT
jgi:excisionase family DNA binding protein